MDKNNKIVYKEGHTIDEEIAKLVKEAMVSSKSKDEFRQFVINRVKQSNN